MPIQRTAWKEAAWIFLLSRFVIILVTYISFSILPLFGQTSGHICTLNINSCIFSWFHWDAIAYVNIAHHGYSLTRDTVFFPLWPLLIHGAGVLFGASTTAYYIAGLLLSNSCSSAWQSSSSCDVETPWIGGWQAFLAFSRHFHAQQASCSSSLFWLYSCNASGCTGVIKPLNRAGNKR